MNLPSLLRKEVLWSRHRALTLVFLLLLLPAFFAFTTTVFQTVVPEDTPIAIVPENESVTDAETEFIRNGAAVFSDPAVYENKSAAMRALRRESVYAVVEVPPGILEEGRQATFTLTIDGSVVPFQEASKVISSIMEFQLDRNLDADIEVERAITGNTNTLSEYLMPVFLMGLVMLFAFTYLPYNLAQEADVLERLLVETRLETVVLAKISYMAVMMALPLLAFFVVGSHLGYSVTLLRPAIVFVFMLTFVYLATISASVMILTRFGSFGRFLNVALLFGSLTFSSLVYPVGFFSPLRAEIARQLPLHYSMIIARSLTLKGASITVFTDWVVGLLGFTLLTLLVLKGSVEYYERTV